MSNIIDEGEYKMARRTRKRKSKKSNRIVYILSLILLLLLILDGFAVKDWLSENRQNKEKLPVAASPNDSGTTLQTEDSSDVVKEDVISTKEVSLMAVGDNLIHTAVWQSGLQPDGTHDYTLLYSDLAPYLETCDLKVINQETIFGGDEKGLQDYPVFNSPQAIGDTLEEVGFNVVLHASNHGFDMGLDGLLNCVSFWKNSHPDMTVLGIYETQEEQSRIPVIEINGIKFALLNYTYSHNAETFSTKAEGHLNMLCNYDANSRYIDFNTIHPQVLDDIRRAESMADFTIVFPHWGIEYTMEATSQEIAFARQMTEAGADLIIGTHPHVIQPVEWVTADNGNRALCYYSLGNYTSAQDGVAQMLGGMANLTIVQDESGTYIREDSIKAIPLVTHFIYPGWTGSSVVESTYLLEHYTEEQAAGHGLRNAWGIVLTKDELLSLAQDTFGEYLSME